MNNIRNAAEEIVLSELMYNLIKSPAVAPFYGATAGGLPFLLFLIHTTYELFVLCSSFPGPHGIENGF